MKLEIEQSQQPFHFGTQKILECTNIHHPSYYPNWQAKVHQIKNKNCEIFSYWILRKYVGDNVFAQQIPWLEMNKYWCEEFCFWPHHPYLEKAIYILAGGTIFTLSITTNLPTLGCWILLSKKTTVTTLWTKVFLLSNSFFMKTVQDRFEELETLIIES